MVVKKLEVIERKHRRALIRINTWILSLACMVVAVRIRFNSSLELSLFHQIDIFLIAVLYIQIRWWAFRQWGWIFPHEIFVANCLALTDCLEHPFQKWVLKNIGRLDVLKHFFHWILDNLNFTDSLVKLPAETEELSHQNFRRDRLFASTLCWCAGYACVPLMLIMYFIFRHDVRGVLYPIGYVFVMMMFFYLAQSQRQLAEIAQRGDAAEEEIARLIEPVRQQQGGTLYSLLQNNRVRIPGLGDLDILLITPSAKNFAISVKSLEGEKVKVFFDSKLQTLRYRKGRGSKKTFESEPTSVLQEQVEWVLANKNLIRQQPAKLVVFRSPAVIDVHKDSPTIMVGNRSFLYFNNAFVVMESDLTALISELLEGE